MVTIKAQQIPQNKNNQTQASESFNYYFQLASRVGTDYVKESYKNWQQCSEQERLAMCDRLLQVQQDDSISDTKNAKKKIRDQYLQDNLPPFSKFIQQVHLTLTDPSTSMVAYVLHLLIMSLILVASISFCIESLPSIKQNQVIVKYISVAEVISLVGFTIEYVAKLVTAPHTIEFATQPLNVIDLVAIMPNYIEIFLLSLRGVNHGDTLKQASMLRVIRLVRVFRVLKLGSHVGKLQVVVQAVFESLDMLIMLIFMLCLAVVIFSSLMYFCERESQYTPFKSIPECFWWCLVTLMTVGYGDLVPGTYCGQVVSSFAMMFSILTLALPISVIGANFTQQWIQFRHDQKAESRRTDVWNKYTALQDSLQEHNSVVQDVLQNVKEIQQVLEEQQLQMRRHIMQARSTYVTAVSATQSSMLSVELVNQLTQVRDQLLDGLKQLSSIWLAANAMQHFSGFGSQEIHQQLDQLHMYYKTLQKWESEGIQFLQDCKNVDIDLQKLFIELEQASQIVE